ncbi:MAG TPA: response regulator [Terriglobales bacterium]|nr:response regulator [Terriglobales bacterium]
MEAGIVTKAKRVLIAEDDVTLATALTKLLEQAGFEATSAFDGREALDELQRQPYDLLVLDIRMPVVDGFQVMESLQKAAPRPKVIVITADTAQETVLQAMKEQVYQFVPKPFSLRALVQMVGNALNEDVPPIEVVSARPHWVELLVPCHRETAERITNFMAQVKGDLPQEVRDSVGQAFREMLLNAVEWGGRFDPSRKVRIAYLRANRMVMYRIADPGAGFTFKELAHAAIAYPDDPIAHMKVREEKGLRPGGFGILLTRSVVDELIYNEKHNEVVLIKYL